MQAPDPNLTPETLTNEAPGVPMEWWSHHHHKPSKLPKMGMGNAGDAPKSNVVNDPFNYEQKYPPDEVYQELSSRARVWKMYIDETTRYDVEMVDDWRDTLDMLLIFAALFSAVLSTFISQTSQALQVDKIDILSSMMTELVGVQRAIGNGTSVNDVPVASFVFRANASDLWLNGLWFTSLGLSLTASLMAVLAKQWIHQYLAIPSGTPLARTEIRHFRYRGLLKWRVPLIISLLPILMHISLGLFFVGLVIYLYGLSHTIAADLGFMTCIVFGLYIVSNVLPAFFLDCPYKTPLAEISHNAIIFLRDFLPHFTFPIRPCGRGETRTPRRPDATGSLHPERPARASLKVLERFAVESLQPDQLRIHALTWLYTITPNPTVQSIIIQSLSSAPLHWIPIITQAAPDGIPSVLDAIETHYRNDYDLGQFERFQRAALRFRTPDRADDDPDADPDVADPDVDDSQEQRVFLHECQTPSVYSLYRDPIAAVELVKSNLLAGKNPDGRNFDVILWGTIFTTALRARTEWLGISRDTDTVPSRYWALLLGFAADHHNCRMSYCDNDPPPPLYSFPGPSRLRIVKYDTPQTATISSVGAALADHMFPSFITWLLDVGFPKTTRSSTIPDDIVLQLAMVKTPSIQRTSSLHEKWMNDYPAFHSKTSLFRRLVEALELYAVGYPHSDDVQAATISVLQELMKMDVFGTNTIIVERDEATIVRAAFKGLNKRLHREYVGHDFSWLTPHIVDKIVGIAFAACDPEVILGNVLSYVLCSGINLHALEGLYRALLDRDWLENLRSAVQDDIPHMSQQSWKTRESSFVASAYVDGLATLSTHFPAVYVAVVDHLSEPENLTTICKILLSADVDTQERLWKLAKIVQVDHWHSCLEDLVQFAESDKGKRVYEDAMAYPAVGIGGVDPKYLPPGEIAQVAARFAMDVERGYYVPPQIIPAAANLVNNNLVADTVAQGAHEASENIIISAYCAQEENGHGQV